VSKSKEFTSSEIKQFHSIIIKNIKQIRKEKHITQLDLALSIGHKSTSTIGKIEASLENKHYNIEQLYKISKVLEVNICEFFITPPPLVLRMVIDFRFYPFYQNSKHPLKSYHPSQASL